jgi:hypothetical protein
MTVQRLLIVLLVANLFATLLVYRGMEGLVERVDRLQCEDATAAGAGSTGQRSSQPEVRTSKTSGERVERVPGSADGVQSSIAIMDEKSSGLDDRDSVEQGDAQAVADLTEEPEAVMDDLEAIQNQYTLQAVDSVQTTHVYQVIQDVANASTTYLGITQDLVGCKEKICKLVLGYADQAVFDAFVDDLIMAFKGELSTSLYFDETRTVGGNSMVDVYLVRE